jgi:putative oxidoreductase
VLGLVLIWKGIAFIVNLGVLANFLRTTGITDEIGASVSITLMTDLIIIFHLIGGVCIALDLRTRFFCLLNLPVLLGAVLLVGLRQNIFKPYSEFWLSLLVLLAIICFLMVGDDYSPLNKEKNQ